MPNTYTTTVIVDSSPDFGDDPQTITEAGKPESVTIQNLIPNTSFWTRAELYENGVLADTSEVETFSTLPAGSLSLTYYSTTRSGYLYDYTWNYTSTYAPSSVICTVNNSTFNGYFDYNQHTLNFNITGLSPSTTYPTVVTLTDIYGETVTVNGSITTTYVNNIYIMDYDAEENFVDVGLSYVVDGGFFSGWVDVWYDYQDPSTDLSIKHYSFSEGDTVIHCDGLADNTGYLFRASITLDDRTTVINSNVVDVDTLEATYLNFTDISGTNNTLKLRKTDNSGNTPTVSLEYSFDKSTWTTWEENNNERSVVIPANGTVYLRGNNPNGFALTTDNNNRHTFTSTGNVEANGDVMRIINKDRGEATTVPAAGFRSLFYQMSTLKKAPAISATTFGSHACCTMFHSCTGLTDVSNIKITNNPTFTSGGIRQFFAMFYSCRTLTRADVFNGGAIVGGQEGTYREMFGYCSAMTTAPTFTINNATYQMCMGMFYGCSALTDASTVQINDVSAASTCYQMFNGCTSLTTLPIFSKNITSAGRFSMGLMFKGCTSITIGLDLRNITYLGTNESIDEMYNGCTSLSIAYAPTVTWNTGNSTDWLNNVAATGTLYADESIINSIPTSNASGCPTGWSVEKNFEQQYFTIKNESNISSNTIKMTAYTANAATTVYVSTDGGNTWTDKTTTTSGVTLASLGVGESLLLKHTGALSTNARNTISASVSYSVYGNVASLCFGDNFIGDLTAPDNALGALFFNSTNLISAENLKLNSFKTLGFGCYVSMFNGCTTLRKAPELPATTLGVGCYESMFNGCTSLTTAPKLPATTLTRLCYRGMFNRCTSLTTPPELPATTLADSCYASMFNGCTSLTTPPELPATILAYDCYNSMFYNCSGLTTTPELPATTLADSCYAYMFDGCSNITTPPELPATTLAQQCYADMFTGCAKLTIAPELPATTLATDCYNGMFSYCSKLTTAPELPATTLAQQCYRDMFKSCGNLTTPPALPATTLATDCYNGMFYDCVELITAPELPATTLAQQCYASMFYHCSSITTPPVLQATTLAPQCYESMFENCIGLTTAPILPATTLAGSCYKSMFAGTRLTTAPALPATTLAGSCYASMFKGCPITTAPSLPATTLESYCYFQMFYGCGGLTTAPALPATTLTYFCYYQMFYNCSGLRTAPELPATTLENYCYYQMFYGCSNLNNIKVNITTWETDRNKTTDWVYGVSATGTFTKPSGTSIPTGTNGIPSGWTVVNV